MSFFSNVQMSKIITRVYNLAQLPKIVAVTMFHELMIFLCLLHI